MNLPIDIIYTAIDSVGDDVSTLKSLSLTSKLLAEYSQRRLLRHPNQTIELAEEPLGRLASLSQLLEEKPNLATAIKSFSLTFSWHKTDAYVLEVSPLQYFAAVQEYMDLYAGPILAKLFYLESVRLESLDYYEIVRPLSPAYLRWLHHLSSPNLTSISVAHLPFSIPNSLRARAPQLQTIISDCAPIRIHSQTPKTGVPPDNTPSPVYLRAFTLISGAREGHQYVNEPEPKELFTPHAENTVSFRELRVFTFGSISLVEHQAAAHIMSAASKTLRHLIFRVPERSSNINFGCACCPSAHHSVNAEANLMWSISSGAKPPIEPCQPLSIPRHGGS
jgi:hypothetical protein